MSPHCSWMCCSQSKSQTGFVLPCFLTVFCLIWLKNHWRITPNKVTVLVQGCMGLAEGPSFPMLGTGDPLAWEPYISQ